MAAPTLHSRQKTVLLTLITVVLFLSTIALTQILYDRADNPLSLKFTVSHRHVLNPNTVPYVSFGFPNILADYYWISAIQDLSGWNYEDMFYYDYFKNIALLDPKFEYPYLFGILTLPSTKIENSMDIVASISDQGIRALPKNWDIPFYLATKFKTFAKNDSKTEHYLAIAAQNPDAPPLVGIFYSAFTANKLLGRDASIAMLKVIRDTTDSGTIKKIASRGITSETIRNTLENGVLAYRAKFGVYPKTLSDLTKNHLVTLPKELEDMMVLEVNQKTGAIRIIQKSSQ